MWVACPCPGRTSFFEIIINTNPPSVTNIENGHVRLHLTSEPTAMPTHKSNQSSGWQVGSTAARITSRGSPSSLESARSSPPEAPSRFSKRLGAGGDSSCKAVRSGVSSARMPGGDAWGKQFWQPCDLQGLLGRKGTRFSYCLLRKIVAVFFKRRD